MYVCMYVCMYERERDIINISYPLAVPAATVFVKK